MRDLRAEGPQTVPQMARARPVSRQHVQVLVNGLLAEELVARAANVAHRRSSLIALDVRVDAKAMRPVSVVCARGRR